LPTRTYASVTLPANTYDGRLEADEIVVRRDDDEIWITIRGRLPKGEFHDVLREAQLQIPLAIAASVASALMVVASSDGDAFREIRSPL